MSSYEFVPRDQRPKATEPDTSLPTTAAEQASTEASPLTVEERLQRSAPHRERLTDWVCRAFEPGQARCCLVGPSCGGHVDLNRAVEFFAELHLLDTSQESLDLTLQHQGVEPARLHAHIEPDFAGITAALTELKSLAEQRELRFHDVQEVIVAAQNMSPWPLPQDFDVVLSAEAIGLALSACAAVTGGDHPSLPDLMHAMRIRHVQEMLRLCRGEGIGMVINQLVSSRIMPSLPKIPADKLEWVLSELVQKRRVPIGTSPIQLRDMLEHDQELQHRVSLVHLLRPWIFDAGSCQYAMSGVSFRKKVDDDDAAESPPVD